MCHIPNDFRNRAISLYSCKFVDKEISRIVSNTGIYRSSDKVGTVYLVQYIIENSTVKVSSGSTIAEAINVQHIRICECAALCTALLQRCAQHSYSVNINSYSSQQTLHTDSHVSYSGAVRRERRTVFGAKSKILYSEIALFREPLAIGLTYSMEQSPY
jgi:hypothetical protein